MKMGDEIGGHIVSGHVHGRGHIVEVKESENNHTLTIESPAELSKYIFTKGFIALDGVSLTVTTVSESIFSVSLIPETLKRTTFNTKKVNDTVNIEVDQQTRTVVDTLERMKT